MKALVFPGQGAQYVGMGKDLCSAHKDAKLLFDRADATVGWSLSDIMFEGSAEDLVQTRVTQPAIFLESIAKFYSGDIDLGESMGVAGHSLGEFTALVAARVLEFEDALLLVQERALAMQEACELAQGAMAAVLGLEDSVVEAVCDGIDDVVPANYNTIGQLVISGSQKGVLSAKASLEEAGARRVVLLEVGGAFHSPLMKHAEERLARAIERTDFHEAKIPVYQNVDASPYTDAVDIKNNLLAQLTSPVRWTNTILRMCQDGAKEFVEIGGRGSILGGMVKKIDRSVPCMNLEV